MLDKLQAAEERFAIVTERLADPHVLADRDAYLKLAKEHAELSPLVQAYQAYLVCQGHIDDAREMIQEEDDEEIRQMAREELAAQEHELEALEDQLKELLIPKDPLDDKNIILEIRAGAGGDEAALFAGDLLLMYERLASTLGWKVEILSASSGTVGGFKEVIALVSGEQVYSVLKYEAGVHRVQRVPTTESQGRIHTSTCTVAILPEAEEVDVEIHTSDLDIDTYRASGAGGQHVNVTDSAVRITHVPTGIVVTSQDERSQHKNKARAMKVLRSRILEAERERAHAERSEDRRSMVGTGDRSERIRTYNFPQNRITDHRIGLTLHNLDRVLGSGDIMPYVEALRAHEHTEQLGE